MYLFKVYVSYILRKHNINPHADKWGEILYEFINTHIDSLCFGMTHLKNNYYHMIKKAAQVIVLSNQQIKVLKLDKMKANIRHAQNNIYNTNMDNIKIVIDESKVCPIQNLSKMILNRLSTNIKTITLSNEIQYTAKLNETNRSHEEQVSSKSIRKRKSG